MTALTMTKGALDFIVGMLNPHVSTDVDRPILTGVFFDAEHSTVVAVDSFSMATWTPITTPISFADRSCIIPARLLADLGKSKCMEHTVFTFDLEKCMATTPEGATVPFREVEGTFPSYRNLIPTERTFDPSPGSLSAWNLGKLAAMRGGKAWNDDKGPDRGKFVTITTLYSSPTKPSLFEVTLGHGRGNDRVVETVSVILMTVRPS